MSGLVEVVRRFKDEIARRGARPLEIQADDAEDGRSVLILVDIDSGDTLSCGLDLPSPRPPHATLARLEYQVAELIGLPLADERC